MKPFTVLLAFAFSLGIAGLATAQTLSTEERKVWDEFRAAHELSDLKAMERVAQRNRKEMERIFDEFEAQISYSDTVSTWTDARMVGRALDEAKGGNYHQVVLKMIEKMSLEDRKKRMDQRDAYAGLRSNIQTAVTNKDKEAIESLAQQLLELAQQFQMIGDAIYRGYSLAEVAKAQEALGQQVEAVKTYNTIDQALSALGFQNFPFHSAVRTSRDSLLGQGFNPDAKPGDAPSAPAGNTGTSWSKDPAGMKWSDPVPLKVIIDEKAFDVLTPNPRNSANTFRWQMFQFSGTKLIPFEERFQPMGKPFSIRREGVKVFIDDGSGKEQEIKAISKPNIVEMETDYTDWEGRPQKAKYAWFSAIGGTNDSIFGFDVNFTPSMTGPFTIRYSSACYLKGRVLGQDLTIYDDNASGRFGDPVGVRDGLSTWQPSFQYNDAMMYGKQKIAGPWTEYLEVDGDFYRLKLDPVSSEVRTRKLSVDTGTVRMMFHGKAKPTMVIIEEIGELKGAFFQISDKAPLTVPVGRYQLSFGVVRKGKGKAEDTCEIFPGDAISFEVRKGEESVLELGAPFKFDFQAEKTPEGLKIIGKSVIVRGRAGEMYTRFFDDPPIPDKVTVKGAGKALKMERATFENFKTDNAAAWFPLDLTVPVKGEGPFEVELELKKYDLLGGTKIDSDAKKF